MADMHRCIGYLGVSSSLLLILITYELSYDGDRTGGNSV